jgi:hypothetical protein
MLSDAQLPASEADASQLAALRYSRYGFIDAPE